MEGTVCLSFYLYSFFSYYHFICMRAFNHFVLIYFIFIYSIDEGSANWVGGLNVGPYKKWVRLLIINGRHVGWGFFWLDLIRYEQNQSNPRRTNCTSRLVSETTGVMDLLIFAASWYRWLRCPRPRVNYKREIQREPWWSWHNLHQFCSIPTIRRDGLGW